MKKNNNHKESRLSQLSPESKLLSAELTVVVGGVRIGDYVTKDDCNNISANGNAIAFESIVLSE